MSRRRNNIFDVSVSLGTLPPHQRRHLHDRMLDDHYPPGYVPFYWGVPHGTRMWQRPDPSWVQNLPGAQPQPQQPIIILNPPSQPAAQPAPQSAPAPTPAFSAASQRAPSGPAPRSETVDLRELRRAALQATGYSFEPGAKKPVDGAAWAEMLRGARPLPDDTRITYDRMLTGGTGNTAPQAAAAAPTRPLTRDEFIMAVLLAGLLARPAAPAAPEAKVTPPPAPAAAPENKAPEKKEQPAQPVSKAMPAPEAKKPAAASAVVPSTDPDDKITIIHNPDGSYTITSPRAERTFNKMKENFQKSAKPGKSDAAPKKDAGHKKTTQNDAQPAPDTHEVLSGQGKQTRLDGPAKDVASDSLSKHLALLRAYHIGEDLPSVATRPGLRPGQPGLV